MRARDEYKYFFMANHDDSEILRNGMGSCLIMNGMELNNTYRLTKVPVVKREYTYTRGTNTRTHHRYSV